MARKTALLIGNDDYRDADLQRLIAPWDDVVSFKDVLEDVGDFECLPPLYNANLSTAQTAITRLFKTAGPEDLILLYYTGHGVRSENGSLFFALPDTEVDLLPANALPAAFIRDAMHHSDAAAQVVILDCCHSGAFTMEGAVRRGTPEPLRRADLVPGSGNTVEAEGKYVLTASEPNQSAYELGGESIFTRHLVAGLTDGAAAPQKDDITIQDLHDYLYRMIKVDGAPQRPMLMKTSATPDLTIARNLNPRRPIKQDVLDVFWGTEPYGALGATYQLIAIAEGPDEQLAADARSVLVQRLEQAETVPLLVAKPIQDWLEPAVQARSTEVSDEQIEALRTNAQEAAARLEVERQEHADARAADADEIHDLKAALTKSQNDFAEVRAAASEAKSIIVEQRESAAHTRSALEAEIAKLKKTQWTGNHDPKGIFRDGQRAGWRQMGFAALAAIGVVSILGYMQHERVVGKIRAGIPTASSEPSDVDPGADQATRKDFEVFSDCSECPDMIALPSGTFMMGSPDREVGRNDDEKQHKVTVPTFALAKTEVTFDQWQLCVDDGGCQSNTTPSDAGWGRGNRPVINVSWNQAQEYIDWLNTKHDGPDFRLPSEAEWEYAARAGTSTPFSFGETISTDQANYDGNYVYGSGAKGEYRGRSVPVSDLDAANAWGLRHMHGNVWEWVQDVYQSDYGQTPTDGSPHIPQSLPDDQLRVVRGGSWISNPQNLRSAFRGGIEPDVRDSWIGFRPARTLLTP